jgi:hypothetical protein
MFSLNFIDGDARNLQMWAELVTGVTLDGSILRPLSKDELGHRQMDSLTLLPAMPEIERRP